MANDILIKDGAGVSVFIHTIEDSTSTHYNMSIPIGVSGAPLFVDTPGNVSITSQVSLAPQTLVVSGTVSVGDKVSVAGRVSAHQDGTWSVSVNGQVSLAPMILTMQGTGGEGQVTVLQGTTPWITNVSNQVSIAPQTLIVHVCNAAPGGATGAPQVSVGDAVSVQAGQVAFKDTAGNARTPLTDVDGGVRVGGFTTTPEYVFTRPTDVASYAIGDLVANSTVAGSMIPLSWPVSRLTGGGGSLMVRRARVITPGDNRTADRSYRVHLWNIASTLSATNGDNGVFAPTHVSDYCGYIDVPMHLSAAAGAAGVGVPGGGSDINIVLAASQVSISGLLEARTSILPASGVAYHVILETLPD